MTTIIHAPVLETAEEAADYLDGDFYALCSMATDLAAAGVALPEMFYLDLGELASGAARAIRGDGTGGGEAGEPMNYLGELTTAYTRIAKLLEESEDSRSFATPDGKFGEACRATMPTLCRLIRDAAVQAESEWAARHEHAI